MKNIQEVVRHVIAERILPWIERDGVSKLLLPEQITPVDCHKAKRCEHPFWGHSGHELAIGLTGKAPYCIDKKAFIFTPGSMVFLPGGTSHGSIQATERRPGNIDPMKPSSILWLSAYPFGVRVQVTRSIDAEDAEEIQQMYLLLDRHIAGLMARLLEEIQLRPPDYAGVCRGILIEFMHRCMRAPSAATATSEAILSDHAPASRSDVRKASRSHARKTGKRRTGKSRRGASARADSDKSSDQPKEPTLPTRIQAAQEFIRLHYHMPLTLADIAEASGANADYMGRQFKATTGITPIQYLLEVRIKAARELLLTNLKVFHVSRLVGIEDPYYFSRVFRRITGVSPLEYRRQIVEVIDQT